MNEKKSGAGIIERAAYAFDLPAEAVAGVSYIEITGTREMLVENHKGIIECTENEVKINIGKNILRIFGSNLTVEAMNAQQMKLAGQIETVQFVSV